MGICNLEVEHSINFDFHIILGDSCLRIDAKHLLLEGVVVSDQLKQGPFELEAGLQNANEFAETLTYHHILLWDEYEEGKEL